MAVVLFDSDGPIVNSFPELFKWYTFLCIKYGKQMPFKTLDEFRANFEEPFSLMYEKVGFNWERDESMIYAEYRDYMARTKIPLVDGIEKVVNRLVDDGARLAIASNNTEEVIRGQIRDLAQKFEFIVGKESITYPVANPQDGQPKEVCLLKPHPAVLVETLNRLGVKPEECIYVADQPSDIIAAEAVYAHRGRAIPVVAVTWGYASKERLEMFKPDHWAHNTQELYLILRKHITS